MSDRASNPVLRVMQVILAADLPREKLVEIVAEFRRFKHLISEDNAAEVEAFLEEHDL